MIVFTPPMYQGQSRRTSALFPEPLPALSETTRFGTRPVVRTLRRRRRLGPKWPASVPARLFGHKCPGAQAAASGQGDQVGVLLVPQILDAVREQDQPLRAERVD